MQSCGKRAISAASDSASARARPRSTTRLARPIRSASSARDRPAGEDQVERASHADDARQADGAAVDERDAPTPAEHAEHRILLDHPQIAPQRELEPAGHGVPGDGGDHRLRQQHARGTHRAVGGEPIEGVADSGRRDAVLAGRRRHRLEIGAGAERAVIAEQHAHARVVVALEGEEGVGERAGGRPVDGVAHLRPAQDHGGDRAVLLDRDVDSLMLDLLLSSAPRSTRQPPAGSSRPFRRASVAIRLEVARAGTRARSTATRSLHARWRRAAAPRSRSLASRSIAARSSSPVVEGEAAAGRLDHLGERTQPPRDHRRAFAEGLEQDQREHLEARRRHHQRPRLAQQSCAPRSARPGRGSARAARRRRGARSSLSCVPPPAIQSSAVPSPG